MAVDLRRDPVGERLGVSPETATPAAGDPDEVVAARRAGDGAGSDDVAQSAGGGVDRPEDAGGGRVEVAEEGVTDGSPIAPGGRCRAQIPASTVTLIEPQAGFPGCRGSAMWVFSFSLP
jgi:hypothetical protein